MNFFSKHILLTGCLFFCKKLNAQVLHALPKATHSFIVVSHRGDHTHAPENTLKAFENAINDGADYAEIDLRTTLDSQLIIMHDASVDRMTDGKGLIKDLTAEKIRALKVKDKTHPEFGEFDIPFFKDVLQLCKGKINIYLDFKNADAAVAYKQIADAGMEKQVVVYINAEHQFYEWRKAAPAMPLMVSLPENVKDTNSMKIFLQKFNAEILDGNFDQYTNEMVKVATDENYLVLPDIQGINEKPEIWNIAIQKGIRALQTDHPADLIAYLKQKQLR